MKQTENTKLLSSLLEKYPVSQYFSDYQKYLPYFSALELGRKESLLLDTDTFGSHIYFFVEGRFKVYIELEDGRRKLLRFCKAPMMLGEMELMQENEEVFTIVEAVEKCRIIALRHTYIKDRLMADARFLKHMCEAFAEKMAYFGTRQTFNTLQNAEEKVAVYLVESADASGIFCENQQTVAEELDISYRHFHRILKQYVDNGWIERCPGGYRVLDKTALCQYFLS